jgi:outer membrane protein assembly factor BamB
VLRGRYTWLILLLAALMICGALLVLRTCGRGGAHEVWRVAIPDGSVMSSGTGTGPPQSIHPYRQDLLLLSYGLWKTLRVFDRQGSLVWKLDASQLHPQGPGGSVMSWDVGADGSIYVGTNKNYVYAVAPDFTLRWKAHAPAPRGEWACSPAVAADGTVYVGADREQLYAFSPDGRPLWHRQISGMRGLRKPLTAPDGTVYVTTDKLELVALTAEGEEKWRTIGGTVGIDPLTLSPDGTVIAPREIRGYITAIRPDGSTGWRVNHAGSAVFGCDNRVPVSSGGEAYFCEETAPGHSQVVALDPAGARRWSYQAGGSLSDPVVLPDGRIACVEMAMSPGAAGLLGRVTQIVRGLVGKLDSRLIVLKPDGTLDTRLGIDMMFCVAPPAVTPAGEILVMGEDGVLHAYLP